MSVPIAAANLPAIAKAARLLHDGALVAFPTETVYGLGADAENPAAVARIFTAKGRPSDHPVIVHVADASHLDYWAREVPADARRLAEAFWPGALTLILHRAPRVHTGVTGGQDGVGLRVPSHPTAQALLAEFGRRGGRGIAAPSANRFGHVSPTTAQHVLDDLGEAVAMILDGGACPVGIESTIVAFTAAEPAVLRPGAVTLDAITAILGYAPRAPDADAPRASGTLPSHYAPNTQAHLVPADQLATEIAQHEDHDEAVAVLGRSRARPPDFTGTWIRAPLDVAGYGRALYANLRELDRADADAILIEAPPDDSAWMAISDRLGRATRREETEEP